MHLFIDNVSWMWFNLMLALVGMFFGLLLLKTTHRLVQLAVGILWFLFIPNTLYMVTDLAHLSWELPRVNLLWSFGIIFQFMLLAVLGVGTFVVGVYPFEKVINRTALFKKDHVFSGVFLVFNVCIGIGVILGRVYRLHSWYIFTQTGRVINSTVDLFSSPGLVVISFLIGIVGFCAYFLLRDMVISFIPKKFLRVG